MKTFNKIISILLFMGFVCNATAMETDQLKQQSLKNKIVTKTKSVANTIWNNKGEILVVGCLIGVVLLGEDQIKKMGSHLLGGAKPKINQLLKTPIIKTITNTGEIVFNKIWKNQDLVLEIYCITKVNNLLEGANKELRSVFNENDREFFQKKLEDTKKQQENEWFIVSAGKKVKQFFTTAPNKWSTIFKKTPILTANEILDKTKTKTGITTLNQNDENLISPIVNDILSPEQQTKILIRDTTLATDFGGAASLTNIPTNGPKSMIVLNMNFLKKTFKFSNNAIKFIAGHEASHIKNNDSNNRQFYMIFLPIIIFITKKALCKNESVSSSFTMDQICKTIFKKITSIIPYLFTIQCLSVFQEIRADITSINHMKPEEKIGAVECMKKIRDCISGQFNNNQIKTFIIADLITPLHPPLALRYWLMKKLAGNPVATVPQTH